MGKKLADYRLVHEQTTGGKHPCNFMKCMVGSGDMVAGSEVNHHVESGLGKGHGPYIGSDDFAREFSGGQSSLGNASKLGINVKTDESGWVA